MSAFIKDFQSYSELQGYCSGTASPGLYLVKIDETKNNKPSQYFYNGSTLINIGGGGVSTEVELANTQGNFTATNIEDALNELFQNVNNGKQVLATAIVDKGGQATVASTFEQLANAVKGLNISNGVTLNKIENLFPNLENNSVKYIQITTNVDSPEKIVISVYKFIPSVNGVVINVEDFNFTESFELSDVDKNTFTTADGVIKLNTTIKVESSTTEVINGETYYKFNIDFDSLDDVVGIE